MMFVKFLLALLPIIWLIVALSRLKMPSHTACLSALAITAVLALSFWKLSPVNTAAAALEGSLNALWPICLVIMAALFTYNLTLKTGAMEQIKKMLAGISDDKRVLMLIIGWGFGNFMEGMAGFGTAVAIPASMLAGIGINPINAVVACLVVNSTPTAFGSVGVPTTVLSTVTDLEHIQMAGYIAMIQCILTFISPFIMVYISGGGKKAFKGMIPMLLVASLSFTVPWFFVAKYLGPELPDIIGSICSILCMIAASKLFKIDSDKEYLIEVSDGAADKRVNISTEEGLKAWAPFILIFVLLTATSTICPPINNLLKPIKSSFLIYPGEGGKPLAFSWVNTPGVMIFISAFIGGLIQGAKIADIFAVLGATFKKYWKTIVTICAVLAIAKIMTYSGMIKDIAEMLVTSTGPVYPFMAPLIGVLGAFITGSGTSTCVLFGELQKETALQLGLNVYWITAANVFGAGIGKMVCPQGIAIGTGAINAVGSESKVLGAVFRYFVFYALLAGVICLAGAFVFKA